MLILVISASVMMYSNYIWNYKGYWVISMSKIKWSCKIEKQPNTMPKLWQLHRQIYMCIKILTCPVKDVFHVEQAWKGHAMHMICSCQKWLWLLNKPAGDQMLGLAIYFADHTCGHVSLAKLPIVTNMYNKCSLLLILTFYFLLLVETDGIQFSHNYY